MIDDVKPRISKWAGFCAVVILSAATGASPAFASVLYQETFEGTHAENSWSQNGSPSGTPVFTTEYAENGPTTSGDQSLRLSNPERTTHTVTGPIIPIGTAVDAIETVVISGDFKNGEVGLDHEKLRLFVLFYYTDGTTSDNFGDGFRLALDNEDWTGDWQTFSAEITPDAGHYIKDIQFRIGYYAAGATAGYDGYDLRADNLTVSLPTVPEPTSAAIIGALGMGVIATGSRSRSSRHK